MKRLFIMSSIFLLCALSVPSHIWADEAEDVQREIANTTSQIQALDKEIARLEKEIVSTSQQRNTLSNTIKELTLTRSKLVKEREQTQKKINATGLVIKSLASDIQAKERSVIKSKESLAKMMRDLYTNEQMTLLERMLGEKNFAAANRRYNNIITINDKARENINLLLAAEKSLTQSKTIKEGEQVKLTELKKTLVQKETAISTTKKEKDTLLVETKNKEENYQKLLLENQKKRDLFEKQLGAYEDKLKFILNPNLLPEPGSEPLSWPLDTVFITQLFGKTSSSGRLYSSGLHSGVDFRASVGTAVKSMGDGTVIGTGDTDLYCKGASFGKWVFIKYENGLSSTFGHLSSISAVAGQKVKTGDIVALSGNTGHSTGPHLHVTIYASQGAGVKVVPSISCNGKNFIMPIAPSSAYLDPMLYLPKVSASQIKGPYVNR
jgi:murein DD-endopeptidase MepM/ murein hydrolase activator NlpD